MNYKCFDKDIMCEDFETDIFTSVISGNLGMVNDLIESYGVNINIKSSQGDTPLHLSVYHELEEMAIKLIDLGADVNIRNKGGNTALHWAIKKGQINVALLLINAGAKADIKNKQGKTAVDIAFDIYNNIKYKKYGNITFIDEVLRSEEDFKKEERYKEILEILRDKYPEQFMISYFNSSVR